MPKAEKIYKSDSSLRKELLQLKSEKMIIFKEMKR